MEDRRIQTAERLTKLETLFTGLKDNFDYQSNTLDRMDISISAIERTLAEQKGWRQAASYISHSIVGVFGVVVTYFGVKH